MPTSRALAAGAIPDLAASPLRRWLLFATGLSLLLSAQTWARISVGGMLFQPVLVPTLALFALVGMAAIARVPKAVVGWVTAYVGVMALAVVVAGNIGLEPIAKLGALWLLVIVVGGAIGSDDDARSAGLGYAVGMGLLSLQTLVFGEQLAGGGGTGRGFNPFGGVGNENAFSLYALPALLVAGYFILETTTPKVARWLFAGSAAAIVVGLLTTPNRSGYLGLIAVVVLLVIRGRRFRDAAIIVALGATLYVGFSIYGDTAALDYEFSDRKDSQSDLEKRLDIVDAAFTVALSNPVLGVGLQNVRSEIGAVMYAEGLIRYPLKDAHNVIGEVVAGGGLIGLTAFFCAGWSLWARPREWRELGPISPAEQQARGLVRIMLVLLLVRGFFTGAVLTTPGFGLGLGIALGLMVASRPRPEQATPEVGSEPAYRRPSRGPSALAHSRRLVAFDPWAIARPGLKSPR